MALNSRLFLHIFFFQKLFLQSSREEEKERDEIIDIEIGKIGNNFIFLIDEIEIETRRNFKTCYYIRQEIFDSNF